MKINTFWVVNMDVLLLHQDEIQILFLSPLHLLPVKQTKKALNKQIGIKGQFFSMSDEEAQVILF